MNDDFEYTLHELLDEAKKDASWEPDEKKREELVELFRKSTSQL